MRAYIKAVREYNDALKDGKIAGPNADEVISILTEYTFIKDPQVHREITPGRHRPGRPHERARARATICSSSRNAS